NTRPRRCVLFPYLWLLQCSLVFVPSPSCAQILLLEDGACLSANHQKFYFYRISPPTSRPQKGSKERRKFHVLLHKGNNLLQPDASRDCTRLEKHLRNRLYWHPLIDPWRNWKRRSNGFFLLPSSAAMRRLLLLSVFAHQENEC